MGDAETKTRIAAAALRRFSRGSYETTTVKDICAEAGCARSTFYEYFGDKAAVLHHLLTEQFAQSIDANDVTRDALEALLASPCKFTTLEDALGPATMRAYFADMLAGRHGSFFNNHQPHKKVLTAAVREAQRAGAVTSPCAAPELACLSIFTLSHLSMAWASSDGAFDLLGETFVHLCGLYGLDAPGCRPLWNACAAEARGFVAGLLAKGPR